MRKLDIINKIYRRFGGIKKDADMYVNSFFDLISENLADGNDVKFYGFANFELREKRARNGRNPITGEKMEIAARRVVVFKPSNVFKKNVKKKLSK